jgi:hypothetical protein
MSARMGSTEFSERDIDQQIAQLRQGARRWRRLFRALMLLLVLLLWITFVEHAAYEYRQAIASVEQRDANLANAVEHYVVRVLRNARAVHQLLNGLVRDGVSEVGLNDMLRDRLQSNDAFTDLGVCLPAGGVLVATTDGASAIDARLCAALMAGGEPEWRAGSAGDAAAGRRRRSLRRGGCAFAERHPAWHHAVRQPARRHHRGAVGA